jgi:hypothetical protein
MTRHKWLPLLLALGTIAARDSGGALNERPFVRVGEELTYSVHSSRFGNIGKAILRADPDTIYAVPAVRLSFDFSARVTLFKVSDRTRSWLDAETLRTMRYSKDERSPLGSRKEDVRVMSDVATDLPLDELSFIYFVRALDLAPGDSMMVERHFDPKRNPVRIRATAHNTYEMAVPDPRQKGGTTRLRFTISDDSAKVPLRIETSMPVAGHITMTLQAFR